MHGVPRATGDLDVWVEPDRENAAKVWEALQAFGAPAAALGVSVDDFTRWGNVIQLGMPPRRIDLKTTVTGLDSEEAWDARVTHDVGGVEVSFLGRASLIRNKRATDRPKDRLDIELLEGASGK